MKNKFTIYYLTIFITLVSLFNSSYLFAKDQTSLSSVKINGKNISESEWNRIEIGEMDSIAFGFLIDAPATSTSAIMYKVFLNGIIVESNQISQGDNYFTVKDLSKGSYILKIQPYSEDWEAQPVMLPFFVREKSVTLQEDSKKDTNPSSIDYKTLVLYGLIAVSVIQLIIITILILRKRALKAEKPNYKSEFKYPGKIEPPSKHNGNKVDRELVIALDEMQYSYNHLKEEFNSLKETNSQLNSQIYSLTENVKNLEQANSELSKQKERLTQSKHQLEILQEQKDELFAIAVHDIKNPAAAIKSYVELLKSYDLNATEQQEIMLSLVDTSSRIVNLAQQMSVIIAAQKPEPVLKPEQVNIKQIIDSICNRNFAYAKKKNIRLLNNSSPNTPETQLDPGKIEEVIDNLINNAIKFAPDGTVVQVRTFFNERKISVEIEDNGVGLSEEDTKKAFEKGAKLSAKPTAGEPSSGLGLWIVKNIIEEHGGKVCIKSKIGVGSTFSFELPIIRKN